MKHSDFKLGTRFQTGTGQIWQCTDIGTRTIVAIEIYAPDVEIEGFPPVRHRKLPEAWFKGPPYALEERLFNEGEIARAHIDADDYVPNTPSQHERTSHPGYPHDVVWRTFSRRTMLIEQRYPRRPVLRHDRVTSDGRILHPYGVDALDEHGNRLKNVKKADRYSTAWVIRVLDLFSHEESKMAEDEFVTLAVATEADLRKAKRAQQANE